MREHKHRTAREGEEGEDVMERRSTSTRDASQEEGRSRKSLATTSHTRRRVRGSEEREFEREYQRLSLFGRSFCSASLDSALPTRLLQIEEGDSKRLLQPLAGAGQRRGTQAAGA